jgi:hypothetical protein
MLRSLGLQTHRRTFAQGVATTAGAPERPADQAGAPPAAVMSFDPALYPPAGAQPVVLTDTLQSPGVGVLLFANAGMKVPLGKRLVIDSVQLFADSPMNDTRATWRLAVDAVPLPGLAALTMLFRGATSQASTFERLRVIVAGGRALSVSLTNVDGVARLFGVQLVGWMY